jgi:hypothetical protein
MNIYHVCFLFKKKGPSEFLEILKGVLESVKVKQQYKAMAWDFKDLYSFLSLPETSCTTLGKSSWL